MVGSTPGGAARLRKVKKSPRYLQMLGTPETYRDHMTIM